MLVLMRRRDESIIIETPEGRITIMVVEIRGDKVRIGVEAPKEFSVHRKEIQDRIDQGIPKKESLKQDSLEKSGRDSKENKEGK